MEMNFEIKDLEFLNLNILKDSNNSSVHEQGVSRTKLIAETLSKETSKNKENTAQTMESAKLYQSKMEL